MTLCIQAYQFGETSQFLSIHPFSRECRGYIGKFFSVYLAHLFNLNHTSVFNELESFEYGVDKKIRRRF